MFHECSWNILRVAYGSKQTVAGVVYQRVERLLNGSDLFRGCSWDGVCLLSFVWIGRSIG